MPELPEVESIRLTLGPAVLGRRITTARLFRPDVCRTHSGAAPSGRDLLAGGVVADLLRHGKQLAMVCEDGRALCIHLGMSGQLIARARAERLAKADHIHALWRLEDGGRVVFRDPRRFGGLWTFPSLDNLRARWAGLGPDAAAITGAGVRGIAAASRRAIKAVLLDQERLAGIGNIYADEALFRAGILPMRPGATLTPQECRRLAAAIRRVLCQATRRGGSTLRDYVDANGAPGRQQLRHAVYGRAGEPCVRCRGRLSAAIVAGRSTVCCKTCQR